MPIVLLRVADESTAVADSGAHDLDAHGLLVLPQAPAHDGALRAAAEEQILAVRALLDLPARGASGSPIVEKDEHVKWRGVL